MMQNHQKQHSVNRLVTYIMPIFYYFIYPIFFLPSLLLYIKNNSIFHLDLYKIIHKIIF